MQSVKTKEARKSSWQTGINYGPPPVLNTSPISTQTIRDLCQPPAADISAESLFAHNRELLGQLLQLTQILVGDFLVLDSKKIVVASNSAASLEATCGSVSAHSSRSSSRTASSALQHEILYPENVSQWLKSLASEKLPVKKCELGCNIPAVDPQRSVFHVITPISKTEMYKTLLPSNASESSFSGVDFNGQQTPQFILERLREALEHLRRLYSRIQETRSRMLVTGDLNAGKSTFVNALMRRRVVPSDQQPCTSLFVEVIDAKDNSNREEIHAVAAPEAKPMPSFFELNSVYRQQDKSTYDLYSLAQLREIVLKNEATSHYGVLKVYCLDGSAARGSSLLHNGVVDVSIIDSPGLNIDVMKTLALFNQQEEIDVVVFMVHAENQFTLSGREFLEAAGKEKAFVFVVVNRYDQIENKKRCKRDILEQLRTISPKTHSDAEQLVHFVSSKEFLTEKSGRRRHKHRRSPSPETSQSLSSEGDEPEIVNYVADFEQMEQKLQEFIIHRRAQSKLAPAKLYLSHLVEDLRLLSFYNLLDQKERQMAVSNELDAMLPQVDELLHAEAELIEMDRRTESLVQLVYSAVKAEIDAAIERTELCADDVEWYGLFSMDSFALDIHSYLQSTVKQHVIVSRAQARDQVAQFIRQLEHFASSLKVSFPSVDSFFAEWSQALNDDHQLSLHSSGDLGVEWAQVFNIKNQWQVVRAAVPSLGMVCLGLVGYKQLCNGIWMFGNHVIGTTNVAKLLAVGAVAAGGAFFFVTIGNLPSWITNQVQSKWKRFLKQSQYAEREARQVSQLAQQSLRNSLYHFSSSFRRRLDANQEHKRSLESKALTCQLQFDYWKKMCHRTEDLMVSISNVKLI